MSLKPFSLTCLGFAAAVLLSAIVLTAAPTAETGQQTPAAGAADDPGPALFLRMCGECHDSKRIVSQRRTSADWEDTLKKMIEEGAEGTEKDFGAVFSYLVRTYGKVYINTGTPAEIQAVLGLTREEAEAFATYRIANGPFAGIDAVKKVPSIDVSKLDAHIDALAF